jgi:hypothetical protein
MKWEVEVSIGWMDGSLRVEEDIGWDLVKYEYYNRLL